MLDPFDTLGIAPALEIDLGEVEKRYRDLSRVLHPDRHVAGSPAERRISLGKAVEVNDAWRTIRDPIRRAEALFRRRGVAVDERSGEKAAPEFLMEMMEQREELAAARQKRDKAEIERLAARIRGKEEAALARLTRGFSELSGDALRSLVPILGELRYYRRYLDEVSAIEDESS
ncbi:MAG TPA: Fe-S protein assembly co-chaperone HscB [Polyangiaceae bacterium]|nr:Fe-S protein assembly co-chaperone HscB [Polyangiaceae bacterium]